MANKQLFIQNLHIAQDGGEAAEAAIDFLFKEFDYTYGADPLPDFMQAPPLKGGAPC